MCPILRRGWDPPLKIRFAAHLTPIFRGEEPCVTRVFEHVSYAHRARIHNSNKQRNRDQIANIHWIIKKARRVPEKHLLLLWLIMPKPLTVWITTKCGKFFKRWEYQTTLPASWEICLQVRKQQLELDMEQQMGSKSGKEDVKAVYCYPAYLTYM